MLTHVVFSLSACSSTCCVFARAEEDLSPPLQTPCGSRARLATSPSAWSWFRRATCGPLLYVAGQASKFCTETSFCTSLWAWLPRSFTRLLWIVVLLLWLPGSRSRQSFLECDQHSFLPQLSPQRACGYVPLGQWALLDADMPKLIDRSACLVELVVVESLCSSRACAVPALSTSSAASGRCSRLYPIARPCWRSFAPRAASPELLQTLLSQRAVCSRSHTVLCTLSPW